MNIELYNENWFGAPSKTISPPFKHDRATLFFSSTVPTPFPNLSDLHVETNTSPPEPLIECVDTDDCYSPTPAALSHSLLNSDGPFFIRYTPEGTLKSRWFLVQINHEENQFLNMNPQKTGGYHVTFLFRHTSDCHLCDDNSRWLPLWYEYVLDKDNSPVYESRILLGPNRKPNLKKYILWTDSVHLTDSSCYIHGPFNFDSRSDIIKPNQHIALCHWEFILTFCSTFSIVPPFLYTLIATRPSSKRKY